jgi:hypothetical protein
VWEDDSQAEQSVISERRPLLISRPVQKRSGRSDWSVAGAMGEI